MRLTLRHLVCILTLLFISTTQAAVTLPHVFGNHMVLQQNKPIIVWGWAEAGEDVTVQIGEAKQSSKANTQGEWKVTLPALKASATPLTVTVTGKNTLTLTNVLVGEVWLCSGQSNMEMGVSQINNAAAEIAAANQPMIRLFMVPKKFESVPQKDVDATWKVCSPQTIAEGGWGGFSAAGYFFGLELQKNLNVPIGLIQSAWGGTRIEPWTPQEGFASVPALKDLHQRSLVTDPRSAEHEKRVDDFIKSLESWSSNARKLTSEKKPLSPTPAFPEELAPLKDQQQATALYNGMIYALQPLSMRGIIWYQGESNHVEGKLYTEKTKALVNGWRKVFNQDDLPFYYTLIAPFQYGNELETVLPVFWEAQADALSIPNTGMAVTTDIADLKDIHPKNKQEVGRRLALWALAKTYGKSLVYSGPMYKSFTTEGNKLRLTFDHVGGGLSAKDGKPLSHFEVIDAEQGGYVSATATIEGSHVVLTAPGVSKPVAFRFAWHKLAEPNFANKEGLPAIPFQGGNPPAKRDPLLMLGKEAEGYELVYELDFAKLGVEVAYLADNQSKITKPISRIAYFLELTGQDDKEQYVFVAMDAFTKDLSKIGVPTVKSGATFQQKVDNMTVISNVAGIANGANLKGGNIEFWPNNYAGRNEINIPNADNNKFDFGDQIGRDKVDGHGSMQVHNFEAKQTVFALNCWRAGVAGCDLGIGNCPGAQPDWTFARNGNSYKSKRLRVFVK